MEDIKKLTNEALQDRIAANKMRAGEIEEWLPYADGPAYYNDREALVLLRARQDDLQIELDIRRQRVEDQARIQALETALAECAKQFRSMGCLSHAQMAQTALENKE